jgi:hypothetical protein
MARMSDSSTFLKVILEALANATGLALLAPVPPPTPTPRPRGRR